MNNMGIHKSTRIENYRMFHVWTDETVNFVAEVVKEDGSWVGRSAGAVKTFARYQSAVDWVMDEWRLLKSGHESWEEIAAAMAADQGYDWESLDDDMAQDFIDAARQGARFGAL